MKRYAAVNLNPLISTTTFMKSMLQQVNPKTQLQLFKIKNIFNIFIKILSETQTFCHENVIYESDCESANIQLVIPLRPRQEAAGRFASLILPRAPVNVAFCE
jgi:hypothetical protein